MTGCAILAGVRGGEAADQKGKSKRGEEMQKDEQGEEGAVDVAAAERFAAAIPAGWIGGRRLKRNDKPIGNVEKRREKREKRDEDEKEKERRQEAEQKEARKTRLCPSNAARARASISGPAKEGRRATGDTRKRAAGHGLRSRRAACREWRRVRVSLAQSFSACVQLNFWWGRLAFLGVSHVLLSLFFSNRVLLHFYFIFSQLISVGLVWHVF